jgi:hypothetical protein
MSLILFNAISNSIDSNNFVRCHYKLRCQDLAKIVGDQISKVVVCTKFNDLKPKNQKSFETNILSQFKLDHVPYVLWDSEPGEEVDG